MPASRLYRIIMPVADLDPAQRFYAALLDQEGVRVSPGRHYFACGDVTLALYSPAGDGETNIGSEAGLFCKAVSREGDLKSLALQQGRIPWRVVCSLVPQFRTNQATKTGTWAFAFR